MSRDNRAPLFNTREPDWLPPFPLQLTFPILVLLSLGGYGLLLWLFPLLPRYNQVPLADVRTFTPSLMAGMGYGLLLLLLYGLYGLAYWQQRQQPVGLLPLLLTTAVFALPLLFTYPINANDLYRYFIRGRVSVVHGASPFAFPPAAFAADPYLPLAGEWVDATSPYGPLWEVTAAFLTRLAPDNLLLALLLFKLLGLAAHLATAALLWWLLGQVETAVRAATTLLWAWNPALLLFFVTDAHNDVVMLLWLLLGVAGWQRAGLSLPRHLLAFAGLLLAALTKPIALLLLPFFFLATVRQLPTGRLRLGFGILTAVSALLLTWLTFLPFGSPLDLVQRLTQEAAAGGSFSPSVLLLLINRTLGGTLAVATVGRVALLLFVLFAAWLLWRGLNGRLPTRSSADIFLGYIFQALNFRIWYVTWPFPLLLLDAAQHPDPASQYRLRLGCWLLLTAQLSVLIHSHLRIDLFNSSYLAGHLLGVPFTLLLPFLLARITWNPLAAAE